MTDRDGRTLMQQIAELSSAEDFFHFFHLPYEPEVVSVCRLHIMKRMGSYLRAADLSALEDQEAFLTIRATLKQAYEDFLASTPLKEKVFKVFTDKERELAGKFVSLGSLTLDAH